MSAARQIAIAVALVLAADAATAKTLDIRFHRQNTLVWCWAASIAMVAEYMTGRTIEDCEVLSLYDAALGGPGLCCAGDSRCVRGGSATEIGPIIGNIFGIRGRVVGRALTWSEVVSNIDADRPIIAWVWNSPTSAHVVVIAGYSGGGELVVFDPLRGRLNVPYDGFAANWGPSHNWNISWVFDTARSGGAGQWRTVVDPCTHPAHPAGDVTQCVHGAAHPYDQTACTHPCYDWYGRVYPCHAYDMWPCSHPVHPGGDLSACMHAAHAGHERRVPVN